MQSIKWTGWWWDATGLGPWVPSSQSKPDRALCAPLPPLKLDRANNLAARLLLLPHLSSRFPTQQDLCSKLHPVLRPHSRHLSRPSLSPFLPSSRNLPTHPETDRFHHPAQFSPPNGFAPLFVGPSARSIGLFANRDIKSCNLPIARQSQSRPSHHQIKQPAAAHQKTLPWKIANLDNLVATRSPSSVSVTQQR